MMMMIWGVMVSIGNLFLISDSSLQSNLFLPSVCQRIRYRRTCMMMILSVFQRARSRKIVSKKLPKYDKKWGKLGKLIFLEMMQNKLMIETSWEKIWKVGENLFTEKLSNFFVSPKGLFSKKIKQIILGQNSFDLKLFWAKCTTVQQPDGPKRP